MGLKVLPTKPVLDPKDPHGMKRAPISSCFRRSITLNAAYVELEVPYSFEKNHGNFWV